MIKTVPGVITDMIKIGRGRDSYVFAISRADGKGVLDDVISTLGKATRSLRLGDEVQVEICKGRKRVEFHLLVALTTI